MRSLGGSVIAALVLVAVGACVGDDPDVAASAPDGGPGTDATTTDGPSNVDGDATTEADAGPPPPAPQNKTSFAYHLPAKSAGFGFVAMGADGYTVLVDTYFESPAGLPASNTYSALAIILLDPSGKPVWSKGIVPGRAGDFKPSAVAMDAQGDIYLAGYSDASADFGGGVTIPNAASLTNDYAFLAKLRRSDGQGVYAKRFVSPIASSLTSLAVHGDSLVVAGNFYQKVTIEKTDDTTVDLTGNDVPMFVASLDRTTGKAKWAKLLSAVVVSGPPNAIVEGVSADDAGNVYVGGWFRGTLSGLGAPLAMIGDEANGFVGSFSANGDQRWAKRFGSATATSGLRVNAIASSNAIVAIAGQVPAATDFGDNKPVGTTAASDAFVATFATADGAAKWNAVVGGDDSGYDGEGFYGVAVDAWDQVVAVGDYRKPFSIAGAPLPKPPNIGGDPANPSRALFGMKVDATGKQVWGKAITSSVLASGRDVAAHPSGSFVVGAQINGSTIDLGAGVVVSATAGSDVAVVGWTP